MESFTERQKFTQWWLWTLLIGAAIVPTIIVMYDIFSHHKPYAAGEILGGALVPLAIILLFTSFKLDTKIDEAGVWYRFFPFQVKMNCVAWGDITKAYVRQYSPLKEYGGWGIRYGLGKTGKAFNISGNIGLQLELKNGKRILIGTQEGDRVKEHLVSLLRSKVISKEIINP